MRANVGGRDHGRRRRAAGESYHDARIVHGKRRIGRDLARGCAEYQIGTCRAAQHAAGRELAVELAAGPLQFEADIAVLRLEAAIGQHRASHARHRRLLVKQRAHRHRLVEIAAGRIEIERHVALAQLDEEFAEARGGAAVDLAFELDPAVAAATAGIGRALDHIELHRRRRRFGRRGPHPGRGRAFDASGIFAAAGALGAAGVLGPNRPAEAGPQTRAKAAIKDRRANMREAALAIKERLVRIYPADMGKSM